MSEKLLSSTCEISDKNNMKIISKPHAYRQTMNKTPVKFQKNRLETVGGAVPTRYLLLYRDGRTNRRKDRRTERQKLSPDKNMSMISLIRSIQFRFTILCSKFFFYPYPQNKFLCLGHGWLHTMNANLCFTPWSETGGPKLRNLKMCVSVF